VLSVAVDPSSETRMDTLTEAEVDALVAGAAWYAKYHQHDAAAVAGDTSASAVARREHFESLYAALDKLGARIRRPTGIGR
jgi:hypothetical protein